MKRVLFLFFAFLYFAGNAFASPASTADAQTPQKIHSVSMVELIANPSVYDGKVVVVIGHVRLEFEGSAVYLFDGDAEHRVYKNGLWIGLDPNAFPSVNDRYCIIQGTFNAKSKGHMGLWSGSIDNITRIERWPITHR